MRQRVPKPKRLFAKNLRADQTEAEAALWRLLRSRRLADMKFRRQVPIGTWIVDFVSFEHRLIVEADGSQHADSDRDMMRDQDLAARGFRVLRFWNNEILGKRLAVVEAIFATVSSSPSPGCEQSGAQPPSPTRGEGRKRAS